jgi:hypothetical protein
MKRIIFFPRKGLTDKGHNCLTVKQKSAENVEQCFIAGPSYFILGQLHLWFITEIFYDTTLS